MAHAPPACWPLPMRVQRLHAGDVDVALAGGVDLSLDPFELAGFPSLARSLPIRCGSFDEHSSGFWPGEGCGFVVLMRREEAVAQQHSVRAVIRGWGISSDGSGGITRPEMSGQVLASTAPIDVPDMALIPLAILKATGQEPP